MSHALDQRLDPVSHRDTIPAGAPPGTMIELSTDRIAASERLPYWREAVLRRMVPIAALAEDRPFRGRVRRVNGAASEPSEHSSDAILATRPAERCRIDGCDDISIDLMLNCDGAQLHHGGERRVRRGDLFVLDYGARDQSRAVAAPRRRHHPAARPGAGTA